jgi:regulator of replication initiation timing
MKQQAIYNPQEFALFVLSASKDDLIEQNRLLRLENINLRNKLLKIYNLISDVKE